MFKTKLTKFIILFGFALFGTTFYELPMVYKYQLLVKNIPICLFAVIFTFFVEWFMKTKFGK